jgi:glycerol-3-phosphate dehydrogenase
VHTRTRLVGAQVVNGVWHAELENMRDHTRRTVKARALVNAAGPWARELINSLPQLREDARIRHVKGSHIVVPRVHEEKHAYLLQNRDGRIIFIIPYREQYSLIGTTDIPVTDYAQPSISNEEVAYLCASANAYLAKPISAADVVWTYSGVRPLYDDGATEAKAVTRDYVLKLDAAAGAPLLSIFGGKLTTYRKLAEHALEKLKRDFPQMGAAWTAAVPLPGGDFSVSPDTLAQQLRQAHPWLALDVARVLVGRHGRDAFALLEGAQSSADLGEDFGAFLFEREINHMLNHEWAETADDLLWRRSKCGLMMTALQRQRVAQFIASREAR